MTDHIHTQLAQPKAFRKTLLQTALDTAETTKTLDRFLAVQEKKQALKTALAEALQTAETQLTTFLKTIPPLPEEFLAKQQHIAQRLRTKKTTAQQQTISLPAEQEPVNGLDEEILAIKKRLQSLQF